MHDEAASVFYAKSTFHFHALGALRHFLDQLTPVATKSITSLALKYQAYSNPQFRDNQIWKAKHNRLWDDLCWRVADECSLKNLLLDLTLNISPTTFCSLDEAEFEGIGAAWIKPLWAFQDINLERCWARILCPSEENSVLEVESWKLRKDILGDARDEEAESGRDAYGYFSLLNTPLPHQTPLSPYSSPKIIWLLRLVASPPVPLSLAPIQVLISLCRTIATVHRQTPRIVPLNSWHLGTERRSHQTCAQYIMGQA